MPILPLLAQSYEPEAKDVSIQQLINFYLEPMPQGKESTWQALPTPGTTVWKDLSGSEVRGMLEHLGKLYVVMDSTFYQVTVSGATVTATSKGTLGTSSTPRISMAATLNEIVIADGTNLWSYNILTDSFSDVTDPDLEAIPNIVMATNGYFISLIPDTQKFYVSDLNDGTSYNALFFASAEVEPDKLVTGAVVNTRVWLLGEHSTEIWYNSGAALGAPFDRLSGGALQFGAAAQHSIATSGNSLYCLAKNRQGLLGVVQASSEGFNVISTPALNVEMEGYTDVSDAFSFMFKRGSHTFYCITFPSVTATTGKTWMFDLSTGQWSELQSYDSTLTDYDRFYANCTSYFDNKQLAGDYQSGKIYTMDFDEHTERGNTLRRRIVSPHVELNRARMGLRSIEVQVDPEALAESSDPTLTDPSVTVEISRDRGRTWGNQITRNTGASGEYQKRVLIRNGGVARSFTFRLTVTDEIPWRILGFWADLSLSEDARKGVVE